jgi:hypothetical protein
MKIAFVTGCLEPGRDGVGDYTATLAAECVRLGHEVRLLSLGEKSDVISPDGHAALRLSPAAWCRDGGAAARRWLDRFKPDWVSLQFVPYSFDPRGFFAASVEPIGAIVDAAPRRHVFFHEIWIGSQKGASVKARLSGWWQRRAVRALLRRIEPAKVHTSTAYYQLALAAIGQKADRLRMFGSVPPSVAAPASILPPHVSDDAVVCGHFGTLHSDWTPDPFLADLAALAAQRRRPAAWVAAGSLGSGQERFDRIAEQWQDRVACVTLGRLGDAALAAAFARFDFAVTSVPWNILGKSSSAAALREHGLPVVVTVPGSAPRFTSAPADDAAEDPGFLPYFRDRSVLEAALTKTPPRVGVTAAAVRFLADLDAC